uniref:helix-turn-helix domain-containing protein n=1 Tax=uncultured Caulobacter sp. TaxID=158749 RepID=UPI0025FE0FB3|nr:helix-turn-helix transcriptional regulator [uncultured Caulobacter sp.]
MINQRLSKERGTRLRQAMMTRGHRKATALAADLNISPAALTKWTQGHSMSVDHACTLATVLDISLDWFLMGRNGPDWLLPDRLSEAELDIIGRLRERPTRISKVLVALIREIPPLSWSGAPGDHQP